MSVQASDFDGMRKVTKEADVESPILKENDVMENSHTNGVTSELTVTREGDFLFRMSMALDGIFLVGEFPNSDPTTHLVLRHKESDPDQFIFGEVTTIVSSETDRIMGDNGGSTGTFPRA